MWALIWTALLRHFKYEPTMFFVVIFFFSQKNTVFVLNIGNFYSLPHFSILSPIVVSEHLCIIDEWQKV